MMLIHSIFAQLMTLESANLIYVLNFTNLIKKNNKKWMNLSYLVHKPWKELRIPHYQVYVLIAGKKYPYYL